MGAYVIHDEAADTYTMKTTTYRTFVLSALLLGLTIGLMLAVAGFVFGRVTA